MDKPRNEMTNDTAKLVLQSYRPKDVDARDPRFRLALDQAAHDPDLARWFNQQRILDTFIANKLAEIGPPCKVFSWNNQRLSLTCFKLPSGELLRRDCNH